MKTFLEAKNEFDKNYDNESTIISFLPVHLTFNKKYSIKDKKNLRSEEYYKWQFLYSLIYSGMYPKDYIGVEVLFPKGNVDSKPLKMDAAIFDDDQWFLYYKKYHTAKDQSALDWLRKHLIGVIEFKKRI